MRPSFLRFPSCVLYSCVCYHYVGMYPVYICMQHSSFFSSSISFLRFWFYFSLSSSSSAPLPFTITLSTSLNFPSLLSSSFHSLSYSSFFLLLHSLQPFPPSLVFFFSLSLHFFMLTLLMLSKINIYYFHRAFCQIKDLFHWWPTLAEPLLLVNTNDSLYFCPQHIIPYLSYIQFSAEFDWLNLVSKFSCLLFYHSTWFHFPFTIIIWTKISNILIMLFPFL